MSKSLRDQIADKCIHFNGTMNKQCKAGVKYEEIRGPKMKIPCIKNTTLSADPVEGVMCIKRTFPTEQQIQEKLGQIDQSGRNSTKAFVAAKSHFQKTGERHSTIQCPVCKGKLEYVVAVTNNHLTVHCHRCKLSMKE